MAEWKAIRGARASAEVVDQIRDAFFGGLGPGDWLGTETELADRFGVSRITMRDAVRALEARGMVDVRVGAHGGLRVANSDPDRYIEALAIQLHLMGVNWDEIVEAQRAIEPVTAGLAATRATRAQITALRELVEQSRTALADPVTFTELGLAFHLAVAEASGNRVLHAALRSLRTVQRTQYTPNTSRERAQRVLRNHASILDAIEGGDSELASTRMTEHLLVVAKHRKGAGDADLCLAAPAS